MLSVLQRKNTPFNSTSIKVNRKAGVSFAGLIISNLPLYVLLWVIIVFAPVLMNFHTAIAVVMVMLSVFVLTISVVGSTTSVFTSTTHDINMMSDVFRWMLVSILSETDKHPTVYSFGNPHNGFDENHIRGSPSKGAIMRPPQRKTGALFASMLPSFVSPA